MKTLNFLVILVISMFILYIYSYKDDDGLTKSFRSNEEYAIGDSLTLVAFSEKAAFATAQERLVELQAELEAAKNNLASAEALAASATSTVDSLIKQLSLANDFKNSVKSLLVTLETAQVEFENTDEQIEVAESTTAEVK